MSPTGLTELEHDVLLFIQDFRAANYGNSPSIRDIAKAVGHRATYGVQKAVDALCRKQFLVKVGRSRFLVPTSETKP